MLLPGAIERFAANRYAAIGIALVVITVATSTALVRNDDEASKIADRGPDAEATAEPSGSTPQRTAGSDVVATDAPGTVAAPTIGGRGVIPGIKSDTTPCTPRTVKETGVTDSTITIGQIVTDSNSIPQQLGPAHEGLEAFVKLFNRSGGLCKRKLALEYRNDTLNPAIHAQDARELAGKALAFVGNESLFDQLDYDRDPPFQPTVKDGDSFVPDVGGLAFSYPRSQSQWHAGVIGSVSPTLVGGGQYHFFQSEVKAKNQPCKKGGVVYLQEPTGASEDQARVGAVSLEQSYGMGLGAGNTQLYGAGLFSNTVVYEGIVAEMIADGMNCVFAYSDLQSSINLAKAMMNRGVWPPKACKLGPQCVRVFYVPLSAYDQKFIRDAGDASLDVSTFIPHVPFTEGDNPAMSTYLDALKQISGARPSTFSVVGFASGLMLIEALQPCREAPTRACLMGTLRKMKGFTASGLLGGTTPFRTTRVNFDRYGSFNWKWIFNRSIAMRVLDRNGKRDFYRINPGKGFLDDDIHVARGSRA